MVRTQPFQLINYTSCCKERKRKRRESVSTLLLDSSITTKFASYSKDSGSQVRGCTYKFVRNDRSENCILKEFFL